MKATNAQAVSPSPQNFAQPYCVFSIYYWGILTDIVWEYSFPCQIMTNLESYQLLHPELLTEETLLEILKDRCIEVPKLKSKSKTEMVEIFKRVALPLPQRKCSADTSLRKRSLGRHNGRDPQEATSTRIAKMSLDTLPSRSSNKTLSASKDIEIVNDTQSVITGTRSQLIRPSESSLTTEASPDTNKRKSEKNSTEPVRSHKRQKITWP